MGCWANAVLLTCRASGGGGASSVMWLVRPPSLGLVWCKRDFCLRPAV